MIKVMISNIRNGLDSILANAPQLSKMERWPTLVHYIVNKIIAARSENPPVLNSPTFHLASSSG
ncbi:hypothetical protein SAMN05421755_103136 [Nitrosomonas sp. Nm33]|nr:hypothetical protein SAMN05421755_103136 [Nitrosomonas sp. Nm33]